MQAETQKDKNYSYGLVRVAAVVPKLKVGDIHFNTQEIVKTTTEAAKGGASFIVFPELALTGYTLGDLFHQEIIWKEVPPALAVLADKLKNNPALILVGAPLVIDGRHFNTEIAFYKGKILAVIPKTYLPGYKEFYEERWFSAAEDLSVNNCNLNRETVPVGTDILLKTEDGKVTFAAEICEDLWGPIPPSSFHAIAGANIIANLSASNQLVGKSAYRRELVSNQSARTISGYVYTSSGPYESTTDLVFSGHALIADNGHLIAESEPLSHENQIVFGDIDIDHCEVDRIRTTSFVDSAKNLDIAYRTVLLPNFEAGQNKGNKKDQEQEILRPLAQNPFLPSADSDRQRVAKEVFGIQVAGLTTRLAHTGITHAVIGLSGGLDSTLALLVTIEAFKKLGLSLKNIHALTMPGFGTTKTTKSNAHKLAKAYGLSLEEVDITKGSKQQFEDIGHNGKTEDVTFENVQARYRTMILMNKANQVRALVIGTGDLSEIALGWATFNGDHISHYNVNCSVPKTLVRHVIACAIETTDDRAATVLKDILDTPVSPELKSHKAGKITQKTEDIIGPYELHDFFLYHFVRWGSEPKKILYLASYAYKNKYSPNEIKRWLTVFIKRFFSNQWKRSVMSDGPKVGSVALSPRGDWRMPSDAAVELWLKELNQNK